MMAAATKKRRPCAGTQRRQNNQSIAKHSTLILSLKLRAVKLAITADLVLLLAALGNLNIPAVLAALLALNLLCGLYFKEVSSHENV